MKKTLLLTIATAIALNASVIGAYAQSVIVDEHGHIIGNIINNDEPQQNEQSQSSSSNSNYGTQFYNTMRGLDLAEQWLDREERRRSQSSGSGYSRAQIEAMTARGDPSWGSNAEWKKSWQTGIPASLRAWHRHSVAGIVAAEKRGDYLELTRLLLVAKHWQEAYVKETGSAPPSLFYAIATAPRAALPWVHHMGWSDAQLTKLRKEAAAWKALIPVENDPKFKAFVKQQPKTPRYK
jgi:hypothetical protein